MIEYDSPFPLLSSSLGINDMFKACQRKDWKLGHSLECPIYANLWPRILPVNVRAALRILLRFVSGKTSPEELELWKNLKSHIVAIRERNGEQWHRTVLSAKAVLEYSKEAREQSAVPVTEEFVVESFAKVGEFLFSRLEGC